jgi:hypothetical protein
LSKKSYLSRAEYEGRPYGESEKHDGRRGRAGDGDV